MCSSKKTVVFLVMDAIGHLVPAISIVKKLKERGHRVIILTMEPMKAARQLVPESCEVDYCHSPEAGQTDKSTHTSQTIRRRFETFRQGPEATFVATYTPGGIVDNYFDKIIELHDSMEVKLKSLNPDLIICDHVCGIPCATYLAPRWVRLYSSYSSIIFENYNDNIAAGIGLRLEEVTPEKKEFLRQVKFRIREKIGQFFISKGAKDWSNRTDLAPSSPYLNFHLGPQELGLDESPSIKPLPSNWFRLEHTIDPAEYVEPFIVPEMLKNCPGKLIYVSFGTLVSSDVHMMNRLLNILSKSANRFIISMGDMHEQIKLHPNMWGQKFINQRSVLSTIDLFITHGGYGSIVEAFYYGVGGLIVMPVFADQFDSAQRVQDLEFGLRMNPFECQEKDLLEAIESQLADEKQSQRIKTVSCRLKSIDAAKIAAEMLERLMIDI